MTIQLGSTQRDRITGFQGVVTGFVTYITGCNQALLAPPIGADGALRDSQWFDETRLQETDAPVLMLDTGAGPGFDRAAPKR